MPYMRIYKGEDCLWHTPTYTTSERECKVNLTSDSLRIGGGLQHGNDEDPPKDKMCPICFKALHENRS